MDYSATGKDRQRNFLKRNEQKTEKHLETPNVKKLPSAFQQPGLLTRLLLPHY